MRNSISRSRTLDLHPGTPSQCSTRFEYGRQRACSVANPTTRFAYQGWRPVTAIQRTDIWLPSGVNVSDPSWVPLLRPTPNHPDYVSTHSTFGGAAAAVLGVWNGGDVINASFSSNVTLDNRGVITRSYTSLKFAAEENSRSRVYGGVSRRGLKFPNAGE